MDNKILMLDLSNGVSKRSGLAKRESETFVRTFFGVIEQYLNEDKIVKIKGLGTFKVVEVSGRDSVNVNTGERIHIKGHSKVTFTPDSAIRDYVNRPFAAFETIILNDGVDMAAMEYVDEPDDVTLRDEEGNTLRGEDDVTLRREDIAQPIVSNEDESLSMSDDEPADMEERTLRPEPIVEEPIVEESIVEEPITEESVVEVPAVDAPVLTEDPVENVEEEDNTLRVPELPEDDSNTTIHVTLKVNEENVGVFDDVDITLQHPDPVPADKAYDFFEDDEDDSFDKPGAFDSGSSNFGAMSFTERLQLLASGKTLEEIEEICKSRMEEADAFGEAASAEESPATDAATDEDERPIMMEEPAVDVEDAPVAQEETPTVDEVQIIEMDEPSVIDSDASPLLEESPIVVEEESPIVVEEESPIVVEETPPLIEVAPSDAVDSSLVEEPQSIEDVPATDELPVEDTISPNDELVEEPTIKYNVDEQDDSIGHTEEELNTFEPAIDNSTVIDLSVVEPITPEAEEPEAADQESIDALNNLYKQMSEEAADEKAAEASDTKDPFTPASSSLSGEEPSQREDLDCGASEATLPDEPTTETNDDTDVPVAMVDEDVVETNDAEDNSGVEPTQSSDAEEKAEEETPVVVSRRNRDMKRPRYVASHSYGRKDNNDNVDEDTDEDDNRSILPMLGKIAIVLILMFFSYLAGSVHLLDSGCKFYEDRGRNASQDHSPSTELPQTPPTMYDEESINLDSPYRYNEEDEYDVDDEEDDPVADKAADPTADKSPSKPTADKSPSKPATDQSPSKPATDKPASKPAADKATSNAKTPATPTAKAPVTANDKPASKPQGVATAQSQANQYPQVKGGTHEIVGVKCTYTMQRGESISMISRRYFGDSKMNSYIIKLNNLKDPDHVEVGQVLKIPELKQK